MQGDGAETGSLNKLYTSLSKHGKTVAKNVDGSVVGLTTTIEEKDWFDILPLFNSVLQLPENTPVSATLHLATIGVEPNTESAHFVVKLQDSDEELETAALSADDIALGEENCEKLNSMQRKLLPPLKSIVAEVSAVYAKHNACSTISFGPDSDDGLELYFTVLQSMDLATLERIYAKEGQYIQNISACSSGDIARSLRFRLRTATEAQRLNLSRYFEREPLSRKRKSRES